MSVTQDYKTITLTGAQCFAIQRALQARIAFMGVQAEESAGEASSTEMHLYAHLQMRQARALLDLLSATPFNYQQIGG